MLDDAELLRRYADDNDQTAFAELVRRHIDVVYAAAVRRLHGDSHRAADVTQAAFTLLAQKAPALRGHTSLIGWLHTSTRYAALDLLRAEQRRLARETQSMAMNLDGEPEPVGDWEKLRPRIDAALDTLPLTDREAILLRYFSGQPWAAIAARLDLNEDAARRRVERALVRLRRELGRHGLTSTATALGTVLTAMPANAAPAALAASVTQTALATAACAAGVQAAGFASLVGATKANGLALACVAAAASFLMAAGVGAYAWQQHADITIERADDAAASRRTATTLSALRASRVKPVTPAGRSVAASTHARPPSLTDALAADPEFQALRRRDYRLFLQGQWSEFFKSRHIAPATADALKEWYVRKALDQPKSSPERLEAAANTTVIVRDDGSHGTAIALRQDEVAEVRGILGEADYVAFTEFQRHGTLRSEVADIVRDFAFTDTPLSPEQESQLAAAFSTARFYAGTPDATVGTSRTLSASENQIVQQVAPSLTSSQLQYLRDYLIDRRVARTVQNQVKVAILGAAPKPTGERR